MGGGLGYAQPRGSSALVPRGAVRLRPAREPGGRGSAAPCPPSRRAHWRPALPLVGSGCWPRSSPGSRLSASACTCANLLSVFVLCATGAPQPGISVVCHVQGTALNSEKEDCVCVRCARLAQRSELLLQVGRPAAG